MKRSILSQVVIRDTCFCLQIVCCLLFSNLSIYASQIEQRRGTTWVGLRAGEAIRLKNYEVTEEIDPATLMRKDYIKRSTDKELILFYTHRRGVAITLGHQGHLILINDNDGTKSNKVIVADLDTSRRRQIDLAATKLYQQNASPDKRLIIMPEAYGFSPDDREALIKMKLVYVSMGVGPEAEQAAKTYKEWWYVVDTRSGQVKHEYRTNKLPKAWWMY